MNKLLRKLTEEKPDPFLILVMMIVGSIYLFFPELQRFFAN